MPKYKLTRKAVEDLSNIWNYTFEVWTEKQADKYYNSLITACQEIAENLSLGKNYEGISNQLFGMKANKHIIFYRILEENYIEITRILHEKMDLKQRVEE